MGASRGRPIAADAATIARRETSPGGNGPSGSPGLDGVSADHLAQDRSDLSR